MFTLVNGQVMKTSHAPEDLILSAVPLPRDLAKVILPEDMQVPLKLNLLVAGLGLLYGYRFPIYP